jgi:hypothetical protein
MVGLIQASGTGIVVRKCKESEQGVYAFSEKPKLDPLTIGKNNIHLEDAGAVWDVLAHEATRIPQARNGGEPVVKEGFHPRVIRRLKAQAPHDAAVLEERYRDADALIEMVGPCPPQAARDAGRRRPVRGVWGAEPR